MKISTSSPYRKNAIVNITRALVATDRLQKFYTTLYLAQWERTAKRVPFSSNRPASTELWLKKSECGHVIENI